MIFIYFIILLLFGIALAFALVYFSTIKHDEQIKSSWQNVNGYLKNRHNYIITVLDIAREHIENGLETIATIEKVMEKVMAIDGMGDMSDSENELTRSMNKLFLEADNYPELKSNREYANSKVELNSIERKLSSSLGVYNSYVDAYNGAIQSFPHKYIAGILKMGPRDNIKLDLAIR